MKQFRDESLEKTLNDHKFVQNILFAAVEPA
jgi:hypothetical protein